MNISAVIHRCIGANFGPGAVNVARELVAFVRPAAG